MLNFHQLFRDVQISLILTCDVYLVRMIYTTAGKHIKHRAEYSNTLNPQVNCRKAYQFDSNQTVLNIIVLPLQVLTVMYFFPYRNSTYMSKECNQCQYRIHHQSQQSLVKEFPQSYYIYACLTLRSCAGHRIPWDITTPASKLFISLHLPEYINIY